MIAVIGAMSIETNGLIAKLSDVKQYDVFGYKFTEGMIDGKEVVVCCCGIGKVASASATSIMISKFNPDCVINLGVAGGAKPLKQGDIVISENVVQHDYDATADGLKIGQVHGFDSPFIECDKDVAEELYQVASSLNIYTVKGSIASGDMFVSSNEKSAWLVNTFGARAFDMESGAIAQVCKMMGKKFCSLRAISDNGDDSAIKSFYEFVTEASERSINIIEKYVKTCN